MALHTQLCIALFGTCLFSILLLLECRKLKGYEFPVYLTKKCPGKQAEWKNRSSAINCTESNGYMCLPNENFTDLLEFCYIFPRILVQKDLCLYLAKRDSRVNSYNCRNFSHGCPELNYFSSETYVHPSCMDIENGCFSAEPSCKRQPLQSKTSIDDTTLPIILGVSIPACILCILVVCVIRKKYRINERRRNRERYSEGTNLLFSRDESRHYKVWESPNEIAMFDRWKQDDSYFITTKACEEVEKQIKSRNLVIVAGHSGSGKSAIIQHIALKYREQGWAVKQVTNVEDIRTSSYEKRFFVFNDPFGKESCDEVLITSWNIYKVNLKRNLSEAKLLISCTNIIMSDTRIAHYLVNESDIVDIDCEKYKLSVDEKRHILTRYSSDMNLSDNECDKILEAERYFPLLCKLYSSKEYKNKDILFFTEPETALKDVILEFQKRDKVKYCALALLVLFNNGLCPNDLLENEDTVNKFKHKLKLCGLSENISPSAIGDNLKSLNEFLVINVGDKYRFCHDFVMEVTIRVFGTEYPDETIEYTDISLLRKRERLWHCEQLIDPFTLYLSDNYIEKLGERFFNELIGNRFMDVVLNPCMKEKRIIEALKQIIQRNPEKLQLLLKKKNHKLNLGVDFFSNMKQLYISKLVFICLEKNITPLFALIVLGHTDFSRECLITLQEFEANSMNRSLLPAVYCNGSMSLFDIFPKDVVNKSLKNIPDNNYGRLSPIHIISVYHNYEILKRLIQDGVKTNSKCSTWEILTPLLIAVGNDTQRYRHYDHEESGASRRDETVKLLLSNEADINSSNRKGTSALHIACKMGYSSTVQLLLKHQADINLPTDKGASPLHKACKKGHDSTAQLLLSNGADINLCTTDGTSPLYVACQNGHDSTAQLLLSNGADIRNKNGLGPLLIACLEGNHSTVQLLLNNGADVNLPAEDGATPLYKACQKGHDSIVQLLLNNGANVNLPAEDGATPLYNACQKGHDSIVQLLLNNGADINLCTKDGTSPLYIARQNRHDSIVQLLQSNGADINLYTMKGTSPFYIAYQKGQDRTKQLLLNNKAEKMKPVLSS